MKYKQQTKELKVLLAVATIRNQEYKNLIEIYKEAAIKRIKVLEELKRVLPNDL